MYLFAHIVIITIGISACVYVKKKAPSVLQIVMHTYLICSKFYFR